ncbi:MAG TPA: hypothetical protein VHQ01_06640 [Pyrinomonadaceae bacterium]|nr:hypothetical protein [Pyrinomonadaceae bacterium]
MSIFKKISEKIVRATESGEMKKVRLEAEQRQASKSNGMMAKVKDPIDRSIDKLATRIEDTEDKLKKR